MWRPASPVGREIGRASRASRAPWAPGAFGQGGQAPRDKERGVSAKGWRLPTGGMLWTWVPTVVGMYVGPGKHE